ncbi:MAG: hypothetical protein PHX80_04275 [Candidatus Nanoarchaeia archaeon]|nr:hypothetical protein [Candidatus Nanoarchaeia archaeon]
MDENFGERIATLEADMKTLKTASEENDREHDSMQNIMNKIDGKVTEGEKGMVKMEMLLQTVVDKLASQKQGKITATQIIMTAVMVIFGAINVYATIRGMK